MREAGQGARRGQAVDREQAIRRYLELRPVVRARLAASVPDDLRREFESVTAHQLLALQLLPPDGLSMRQLAAELGVMGATVSVLADRLVAQDLAERMHDPSDRRVVRLVPTTRGATLVARAAAQQRRSAGEVFDRLRDDQVVAFLDVLETLAVDPADRSTAEPGTAAPTAAPVATPGAATPDAATPDDSPGRARARARRSTIPPSARQARAVQEEAR